MYLKHYLEKLNYLNIPKFLVKYLKSPSLLRLKKVGYFCGMDYASKEIYSFREYISRYDHSITTALITYKLTSDKIMTLAALFHDVATPCFSHVIDYMNKDYDKQESTEEYTGFILRNDKYLLECLKEDNVNIENVINFKQYSIVDNNRPRMCADRLDGIILTAIGWTKNITKEEISDIIEDICIFRNENHEEEIGFKSKDVGEKIIEINNSIDTYCHSYEDNYMMELLANITNLAITKNYISYEQLYFYNEEQLFKLLKRINNEEINRLLFNFETIKKEDIENIELPNVKVRKINPLVDGKRFN